MKLFCTVITLYGKADVDRDSENLGGLQMAVVWIVVSAAGCLLVILLIAIVAAVICCRCRRIRRSKHRSLLIF